jgi:hypothetical protein
MASAPVTKTERPAALLILDAKDVLSGVKELNTALYLATHGLGERAHMNALAALTDIISGKIEEVEEILDAAMAARGAR